MTAPLEIGPDSGPWRIRLSKAAGWRMPENTVRVGIGTRFANPFEEFGRVPYQTGRGLSLHRARDAARAAAWLYRTELLSRGRIVIPASKYRRETVTTIEDIKRELAGKNVGCWCGLDVACHGDVLLEVANEWPTCSLLLGIPKPSLVIEAAIEQMKALRRK